MKSSANIWFIINNFVKFFYILLNLDSIILIYTLFLRFTFSLHFSLSDTSHILPKQACQIPKTKAWWVDLGGLRDRYCALTAGCVA